MHKQTKQKVEDFFIPPCVTVCWVTCVILSESFGNCGGIRRQCHTEILFYGMIVHVVIVT